MFWKYVFFEAKIILKNRKNWLLAFVPLLFFVAYFMYYSQLEHETALNQIRDQSDNMISIFYQLPENIDETPEGKEIHENLLEQASLLNFQRYYLKTKETEDYIENGLLVAELRLRAHELGNKGIADRFVIPKDDILKETAFLRYIQEHKLPIQTEPIVVSQYLIAAVGVWSGILFFAFILLSGSDMLVYERNHQSIVAGFPLSFMKKITSKIGIYFFYTLTCIVLGFLLGGIVTSRKVEIGDFSDPVLIFKNGEYEMIPATQYFLYMLAAILLIILFLLCLSALLSMIIKNPYANVLIGLVVLLIPDLFINAGIKATFLYPLKYINIPSVLSGELAEQLGNNQLDYWHAISWIIVLNLIIIGIIYGAVKYSYTRKYKKESFDVV